MLIAPPPQVIIKNVSRPSLMSSGSRGRGDGKTPPWEPLLSGRPYIYPSAGAIHLQRFSTLRRTIWSAVCLPSAVHWCPRSQDLVYSWMRPAGASRTCLVPIWHRGFPLDSWSSVFSGQEMPWQTTQSVRSHKHCSKRMHIVPGECHFTCHWRTDKSPSWLPGGGALTGMLGRD